MLTIKDYILVENLEEAYKLNQNINNVILGGTGWLKLQNRNRKSNRFIKLRS